MASTYSNLKIQLMATGENSGTWGNVTNTNLGTALEQAITGSVDVTVNSDTTLTLTDTNGAQDARALRLNLTGSGAANLTVPAIQKLYLINNATLGTVTVKNATGATIAVPTTKTMWVFSTGTGVVDAVTHLSSLTLGSALPIASGGTGSTSTTYANLQSNVSGVLPVANGGTGSNTATFSGANITSLNASAISSGTLAVARGGTGATDAPTARTNLGAGTVTSVNATAGTGISVSGGPITTSGSLTITNTGVTSLAAGSGISVSGSTGAITISSTGGGGAQNLSVFNSPGTFTTPANTTRVYVVVGGGGGGVGGNANDWGNQGGSGGAGAVGVGFYTVTGSTGYSVTVGGGGNAGASGPNNGNPGNTGGSSSFGSFLTANGGNGGVGGNPPGPGGSGNSGNAPLAQASGVGLNQILVSTNASQGNGGSGRVLVYF